MSNIIDYIQWRGDLSFNQAPFNEIDNLIEALEDPDTNSNEKSEIRNSDLPYEEEKLQVMEAIARSRGLVRGR